MLTVGRDSDCTSSDPPSQYSHSGPLLVACEFIPSSTIALSWTLSHFAWDTRRMRRILSDHQGENGCSRPSYSYANGPTLSFKHQCILALICFCVRYSLVTHPGQDHRPLPILRRPFPRVDIRASCRSRTLGRYSRHGTYAVAAAICIRGRHVPAPVAIDNSAVLRPYPCEVHRAMAEHRFSHRLEDEINAANAANASCAFETQGYCEQSIP